jgi:uncharacterized protein (DUF488 family)
MRDLFAVGHGSLDRAQLSALLRTADVDTVVDVRRFPGSRVHPDVRREALEEWLPASGAAYRWEERLGGRRKSPPGAAVVDTWWIVPAFQAYAAHTRTPEFSDALAQALAGSRDEQVAVMCSETLWWRCHRRLIADVAVLGHGVAVRHLLPSGQLRPHIPASGARVRDDGFLVWDGANG